MKQTQKQIKCLINEDNKWQWARERCTDKTRDALEKVILDARKLHSQKIIILQTMTISHLSHDVSLDASSYMSNKYKTTMKSLFVYYIFYRMFITIPAKFPS